MRRQKGKFSVRNFLILSPFPRGKIRFKESEKETSAVEETVKVVSATIVGEFMR